MENDSNDLTPRVTIGLPVMNGEKYLALAVDAILCQSYRDFELVIVDNASTDRTQEICDAYARRDPRVRYYRNESNIGAAPNHNRAFELSTTEYFKWSGYDDLISPDFLEKCVAVLDQKPEVVLCIPETAIIDGDGTLIGYQHYRADLSSPKPQRRFINFVRKTDMGNQTYGVMRASAIRQTSMHGSFPASDLVFLAELTLYGQFHVIPEYLFFRRQHQEQSTAGQLTTERARVLWFDTSLEGKIVLPKWQYLLGYVKIVRRAPLTLYQKTRCYGEILHWSLIPPHFRALVKDLLLATRQLLLKIVHKVRPTSDTVRQINS